MNARILKDTRRTIGAQVVYAVTGGAHTSAQVLDFMSKIVAPGNSERVFNAYGTL